MEDTVTKVERHHAAGFPTAVTAYAKASRSISSYKERIRLDVEASGEDGITPDEWCDANGALINTVRRRFTDLWKEGYIRHHPAGLTKKNAQGNDCVRWVTGRDAAAPVPKRRNPFLAGLMFAAKTAIVADPGMKGTPAMLALKAEIEKLVKP